MQGVHKVMDKQFVLISGDHPLVQAIRDNQEQLQMANIEAMPENMVKVSAQVYNAIFPLVQEQVSNQIKVTDLGAMKVQLEPAEYSSWTQAMDAATVTQKGPLEINMQFEVAYNFL